jgi:hypothetical protein
MLVFALIATTTAAITDYMNPNYMKSDGNKVVSCTGNQLDDYFDKIDVAVDNV